MKVMTSSARALEELSYGQCLERLASEAVGRLAVVIRHYPEVFVVNYRLDDFVIVFRTGDGPLLQAVNHANVGFQVDHVDRRTHTGWSVLVQGMAEDVTCREDFGAQRARHLGVEPWVGDIADHLVRVIPARITGRALRPAHLAAP